MPRLRWQRRQDVGSQAERQKSDTATKKAIETAKKAQAREEKKALSAKKKRQAAEQKIEKMKANLEKEIEKAKAAAEAELLSSRMAAAKGAAISQSAQSVLNAKAQAYSPTGSDRTERTLEIRSDKKTKHAAGGA